MREMKTIMFPGNAEPFEVVDAKARKQMEVYPTPEMYGAKGDGVTDDGAAFSNMLAANNRFIVLMPNKTYYLKTELPVFDGVTVNLNGSVLEVNTTVKLGDNCTLMNGTIRERGRTGNVNFPSVSVEGKHANIQNVSFTSKEEVYGAIYVKTRTDSDLCRIINCHFDGHPQMSIYLCGNRCLIENCYFEDITHPASFTESYSNCLKLSAEDCLDDVTPCARNTIVRNCYFGMQSDNCIDAFAGADGLVVEDCVFNNGDHVGMEIKNQYRSKDSEHFSAGTSLAGKRICRNIFVNNCEFLGNHYMAVVSVTASDDYPNVEPVYNVHFTNCRMPNLDGVPVSIGDYMVKDVTVDNLILPRTMTKGQIYLYGENTVLRNIDNESLAIIVHGKGLIERCKVKEIVIVNANADVEIAYCGDYGTGGALISATACKSAVIHDCSVMSRNYIVALTGAPAFVCIRNNVATNIVNNGYAASGGKVHIIGNLYKNVLKPTADNEVGIVLDINNHKITA